MTRILLWSAIAFPAALMMLWLAERMLRAGFFGVDVLMSDWFWIAWVAAALGVGNAVAFACDRRFVRRRARSRPLRRVS